MGSQTGKPPADATPALGSGDGLPEAEAHGPTVAEVPSGPLTLLPPAEEAVADEDWATWADLCEPQGRHRIHTLPNGKKIEYTDFVHLDRLASLRMSAMVSGKFDNARFSVLLLKEVLIRPRIETEADVRLALKADGIAMMEVLAEVQRLNVRVREMTSETLGESFGF